MIKQLKWYLLFVLALLELAVPVRAVELPGDVENALPHEAERLLSDVSDWSGDSLTAGLLSIWSYLRKEAGRVIRSQTRGAASILLTVVLCGLLNGFRKGTGDESRFLTMVGGLSITVLTAGSLDTLMGVGTAVMERMATFSKALLPAMAAISAVAGGAAGATVRQLATVFFSELLMEVIYELLLPMVYLYAGTLAAGSCLGEPRLTAIAELLKSFCVKLLTAVLLAFTFYLTVSNIFSGTVDSARVRVAKATISGAVPVVGGIIAEATETVLAGAGVLQGAVGTFGLLGVLALCAYPFLRLGVQYILYKLTAFLAAAVGDAELCRLINGLGGAFGLILGMVGSCALVLLVSILSSTAVVVS